MANLTICVLLVTLAFASAFPQRNRPFPTTKQPAPTKPTTPAPSTTTQAPSQPAPYAAAGFRPGRAFELPRDGKSATEPSTGYGPPAREGRQYTPPPSVDPLPTYLPPSDKYGPPEGAQKPESEATTPRPGPQGRSLQNGFYFIRLPSGFISRTGLLTAAGTTSDSATATKNEEIEDVEVFEPSANARRVAAAPPQVPIATVAQVQPVVQSQSAVQFWPPIKTERIVAAEPSVVVQSPQVLQPIVQAEALVQAAQPLYYIQPQVYSYSSQYRSW